MVLLLKVALGVEEAVVREMKWEEEVAEEEGRLFQEVAVQVLMRWAAKEEARVVQHLHSVLAHVEEAVVAFLQQQRSRLGKTSPLEAVEEGHLREQAAVAGLKRHACPRKEEVRGICLLKVVATQHRPPMASSVAVVEEGDQE